MRPTKKCLVSKQADSGLVARTSRVVLWPAKCLSSRTFGQMPHSLFVISATARQHAVARGDSKKLSPIMQSFPPLTRSDLREHVFRVNRLTCVTTSKHLHSRDESGRDAFPFELIRSIFEASRPPAHLLNPRVFSMWSGRLSLGL